MSLALLDVFLELRRRGLPLGAPELALAQRALAIGYGTASREALLSMCQSLWAKSREENVLVKDVLDRWLPAKISETEIAKRQPPVPGAQPTPSTTPPLQPPRAGAGQFPSPPSRPGAGTVAAAAPAAGAAPGRTLPRQPIESRQLDTSFDFTGETPVNRRHMTRAWRYFRRMQRVGAPTEIDVAATLAQTYRHGVFTGAVLVARRSNQARLAVLEDTGGSMTPFERITRPLLETALMGGFAAVERFYFRNVPGEHLYLDPALTRPLGLDAAGARLARCAVLIVSDAGAARGRSGRERIDRTGRFLALLRQHSRHVAWLNPVPADRWTGTSAGEIGSHCPMFALDRAGLDAAVDVLRGMKETR